MSERFEPGEAFAFGASARRHDHPIEALAVQGEAAWREGVKFPDLGLEPDLDPVPVRLANETVDDRLGRVRDGKHAPVAFGFQGHAPGLKPRDRVGSLKRAEGFFQLLATAGVVLGQGRRGEAVMGDVAASAARDFDLGKEFGRLLEEHDVGIWVVLRRGQRREKARRAAAITDTSERLPCLQIRPQAGGARIFPSMEAFLDFRSHALVAKACLDCGMHVVQPRD